MKTRWLGLVVLLWSGAASASTRICVSVQQKSWFRHAPVVAPRAAAAPAPAASAGAAHDGDHATSESAAVAEAPQASQLASPYQAPQEPQRAASRADPHELDPTLYLKRMLEYEVTHEPGFAAVGDGCAQRLTVELYPLESGWTVFARYSGTEREEKVDHAEVDEFAELAQRIAFALLRNSPISHTITRENVLRSDSETNLRTIDGTGHFLFGMGTEARVAHLPTAQGQGAPAATELRLLTPVSVQVAYRRKLGAWGLDAFARLDLGTESTGIHENDLGGHVDYSTSAFLGLHFLHYLDAPGINSLYFGGGAAFELAFFEAIRPLKDRATLGERQMLMGGGLDVDLLVGYEFLRASSVHFFGQLDLEAPTYVVKTENDAGSIDAYMPGALAQIGIIF
jgi:hypothetical protein